MNSIYIHIPFCKKKCNYCTFISGNYKYINNYFSALISEINNRKIFFNKVDTLYIGGGTPSSVDVKYIANVLESIHKKYNMSNVKEITIELNPESVNKEKILLYKSLGINRFSIGVQSYNNSVLKYLGRIHRKKEIKNALSILETYTKNYSIDLIWGIRNSRVDFSILNDFSPQHISLYLLSIDKGSALYKRGEIEKRDIFIEKEYYYILDNLRRKKYLRYEVSNFAKKNYRSTHNSAYWDIKNAYIGYGVSASSYDLNRRYTNTYDYYEYLKNPLYYDYEIIDNEKKNLEIIMLGLRTVNGIELNRSTKKIINLYVLNYLIKEKFIIQKRNRIFLSDKGFLLINSIIYELLKK